MSDSGNSRSAAPPKVRYFHPWRSSPHLRWARLLEALTPPHLPAIQCFKCEWGVETSCLKQGHGFKPRRHGTKVYATRDTTGTPWNNICCTEFNFKSGLLCCYFFTSIFVRIKNVITLNFTPRTDETCRFPSFR